MKTRNQLFISLFFLPLLIVSCGGRLTDPVGAGYDSLSESIADFILLDDAVYDDFEGPGTTRLAGADRTEGGTSTNRLTMMSNIGNRYLRSDYELGAAYAYRFAVLQLGAGLNLSGYNALQFRLRGSGHRLRVVLRSAGYQDSYDDFGYVISSTPGGWTGYTLDFSQFVQEGWGAVMDFKYILERFDTLQLKAASMIAGEIGWFEIDDVRFVDIQRRR